MPSSTTIPPTSTRRYADGWRVIRVGRSTLPRPPRPGLTPSKASSPSSRANALSAASSNPSLTCNSPSTASSPIPMPIPTHSSGPPTQNASSQPLSAGTRRWSQSTRQGARQSGWTVGTGVEWAVGKLDHTIRNGGGSFTPTSQPAAVELESRAHRDRGVIVRNIARTPSAITYRIFRTFRIDGFL
jgi:hypothetical protein